MISKKIEDIINVQIEKEAYSSHLYLSMASWAEVSGYSETANWFYAQALEERMHMLKFIGYVNERGGKANIPQINKPPFEFENLKSAFKQVLAHEEFITKSINEIVGACLEEKDFTTHQWVQWFVTEQIEEESNVRKILDKLNLMGEQNLYMFEKDIMAMRVPSTNQTA